MPVKLPFDVPGNSISLMLFCVTPYGRICHASMQSQKRHGARSGRERKTLSLAHAISIASNNTRPTTTHIPIN
ncbi:hypothetical protein HZ326_21053 [Fusarium oxysporum f. sp. albedinis]|nr:hypothetical protein HZ326_21053 [Fusarium oxysporum f. sp. albedinis]